MINKKCEAYGATQSPMRELFSYGMNRKKIIGDDKVFDFSIGNPTAPTPQIVNDTIVELVNSGDNISIHGYSLGAGRIETRNAVAESLNKIYHTNVLGKYIYMTCGAAASLTISFTTLFEEGNEAILIAPFFSEYKVFLEQARYKVRIVLSNKDNLLPDYKAIEEAINENTKLLLINSPNNPSGVVYNEEVIKRLADILERKQKEYNHPIFLISDEPYRELIFDDVKYPFVTNYYNNSIVCYSFSKVLSLAGERIGYLLVNPKCQDVDRVFNAVMGAGRALGFVCAPTLFQHVVERVVGTVADLSLYKENRDLLYKELKRIGYNVIYPDGAFYMFVKALEDDVEAFKDKAKELELLLVPSDSFGMKGFVRIAYCVTKEEIINSIPAFEKLYHAYEVKNV